MYNRSISMVITVFLAVASAAPLAAQEAPSNVAVAAGKGTVTVTWTGIRNREVTYRVLRALDQKARGEGLTRPLAFDVTSFVDAALVAGTTYFYQVIAVYPDGREGASIAVQYPAPAVAVAPMPMVTRQGVVRSAPLTQAPPFPLRAPAITATGQYNRVTISWQPVVTNVAPVTYEVRRARVDPATPGVATGYLAAVPSMKPDGSFQVMDREADLHLPTWYRLTTRNTSQGSIDSPWYRRDPPPHRGVDSIVGGYWRVPAPNSKQGPSWVGCVRFSEVPGANMYWARVRTATGPWIDLQISNLADYSGRWSVAGYRHFWFDTNWRVTATFQTAAQTAYYTQVATLFAPLENGGQIAEFQVGPMYSTASNPQNGPYITDLNHLQPISLSFSSTPLLTPLTASCQ